MKSFKALVFALLGVAFANDCVPETDIDSLPPAGQCIGDCYSHDPAVVQRDDGMYFKFSTNPGVRITKSKDLNGPWELVGRVVPGKSKLVTEGGFAQDDNIWVSYEAFDRYYAVTLSYQYSIIRPPIAARLELSTIATMPFLPLAPRSLPLVLQSAALWRTAHGLISDSLAWSPRRATPSMRSTPTW